MAPLNHAHKTRDLWGEYPKIDRLEFWNCVNVGEGHRVNSSVFSVRWDPRSPEFAEGDPGVESERGIFVGGSKKEAERRIFKAVDQYLNRVEKAEEKTGFKRRPRRTRGGRTAHDRMKWVVMRLCRHMTFDKIRAALSNSPENSSTIRKAVNDLIQNLNCDE